MAQISHIVGGKFRIVQRISRGGMSRIYLAEDTHLAKIWVVKEILKSVNGKENLLSVQAALREAEIIKSLSHPGIVRIVDVTEDEDAVYIVEDYIRGISLQEYVNREGFVTEQELFDWAGQICVILQYLHAQDPPVIYRDIKPENLILTESGHIMLIDFGIARRYSPEKDRDTVYLGTEKFAAPEQYEAYGAQTDVRTDIYGLGSTILYLCRSCTKQPAELKQVMQRCVQPDPQDRYQDTAQVLSALEQAQKLTDSRKKRKKVSLFRILLAVSVSVCIFLAVCSAALRLRSAESIQESVLTMTEAMKEDGRFTKEEEEELLQAVMPQLSEWKEQEGFEKTAFNIGKLYWYYYDYGSDHSAGMIESVFWFHLAGDYDEMAEVYEVIGTFRRDIDMMILEADDEGMYLPYFEQLERLLQRTSNEESSEIVRLEVCQLVINSLISYARKFRSDGIEKERMEALSDSVSESLLSIAVTSELTDQRKETLINRLPAVQRAVELACNEKGEAS